MSVSLTGRVKTVIVSRSAGKTQAVLSTVVASVQDDDSTERIRFTGSVAFAEETRLQILSTILPLVDTILGLLGHPLRNYDLSIANLGFASVAEVPLLVRGYSADLPIFIALLSASLDLPVSEEFVCTGHIASPDGDIRAVASIPEKMEAAASDPAVTCFVFPALEADGSLPVLAPRERERIEESVIRPRASLRVLLVRNIAELVEAVVDEKSIVLSALRAGYYGSRIAAGADSHHAGRLALCLLRDHEGRFWSALERRLMGGEMGLATALLLARVRHHLSRPPYPTEFGKRLLECVAALPPHIRRRKGVFPLLPVRDCLELGQIARDSDLEDVQRLLDAVSGKGLHRPKPEVRIQALPPDDDAEATLGDVLVRIEPKTVSDEVGQRIDAARACFLLRSVTTESSEEFYEILEAFLIHLYRHCGYLTNTNLEVAADESYALLCRAFARRGGPQAARACAAGGLQGGLRYVLDTLTDQFKVEAETRHISRILTESMNPADWDKRVSLARALLGRLEQYLPSEIRSWSPEQCAHHLEELVRLWVESMAQVKSLLRTL